MKKIILFVMCFTVLVLFAGCGSTAEHLENQVGYTDKTQDIVDSVNSTISSYPSIPE